MNIKRMFGAFVAVCIMGFVCGLAGGAQWGLSDTGLLAAVIFVLASGAALAAGASHD